MNLGELRPLISVIAPVLNRSHLIREFHHELVTVLGGQAVEWEIIYVEDGSRDSSWSDIAEFARSDPRVRGLRLSRNFGQHSAIAAGLDSAQGSLALLLDVDNDQVLQSISLLMNAIRSGADIAVACVKTARSLRHPQRTIASGWIHHLIGKSRVGSVAPLGYRPTSMRILGPKSLLAIREYGERGLIFGPLSLQLGFDVAMVATPNAPVFPSKGSSNYSLFDRLMLSFQIWVRYSNRLPRVPIMVGLISAVGAILLLSVSGLWFFMTGGNPLSIFVWMATFQVLALGISLAFLGVMTAISIEILRETLHRPRYHIREQLN